VNDSPRRATRRVRCWPRSAPTPIGSSPRSLAGADPLTHTTGTHMQHRVRDALQHSLDAWWQFFDGIQAAI
jgi:hypothetical protein